jgi:osmotically-inducible protein OsmY
MKDPVSTWVVGERLSAEAGLEAAAEARLGHSAYLELHVIRCTVQDRRLHLQGRVSSYYLRQIAQTLVQGVEGVEGVNNHLQVIPRLFPDRRGCLA